MRRAYSIGLHELLYKKQDMKIKKPKMIRIVCPHRHASLAATELEQATVKGHAY